MKESDAMNPGKSTALKIFAAVSFIVMVAVNTAADLLPLGKQKIWEIFNSYPNLLTPAPVTFLILGLIYFLLLIYIIRQLFQSGTPDGKSELFSKINFYFAISSLSNAAWIFAWHYRLIPLSFVLITATLLCLIRITSLISREKRPAAEIFRIRLPFGVYFGWITAAVIYNAAALLVSLGWDGFGFPQEGWTIFALVLGFCLAALVLRKQRDAAFGLAFIWAYAGIIIRHLSPNYFSGQYPAIVVTASACAVILAVLSFYPYFSAKNRRKNSIRLRLPQR
jgi:hypothetical protein